MKKPIFHFEKQELSVYCFPVISFLQPNGGNNRYFYNVRSAFSYQTLLRVASLFMVGVMFSISFGVLINKMTCMTSGRTVLSILPITDCCADPGDKTVIAHTCCAFDSMYLQMEHTAVVSPSNIVKAWSILAFEIPVTETLKTLTTNFLGDFAIRPPPLLSKPDLFVLVQVFRV